MLSPGQARELPCACALLDDLSHPPIHVVFDCGYALHKFREYLWSHGSRPVIPPGKNDPEVACPKWAYRHRHLVENLWARLKSLIRKFFSTDNALRFCGSACGWRRSKSTLLTRLWTFPSLWRAACSDRARRMFVRPPSGEAGFQSPWLCLIA